MDLSIRGDAGVMAEIRNVVRKKNGGRGASSRSVFFFVGDATQVFFNSIGSTCHLFPSPQFTNAFLVIHFLSNHMNFKSIHKKSRFESIRFIIRSSLIRALIRPFLMGDFF